MPFTLNLADKDALQHFLWNSGRMHPEEKVIGLSSAGEGNMNCTLRVTTCSGSFILKQSRPYVERYPQIPAPIDRIHREEEFYAIVRKDGLIREHTPEVLWSDRENHVLALEDLGHSSDFSHIYRKGNNVSKTDILSIAKVMSELHYRFNESTMEARIQNREMKELNHDHIFIQPLEVNNGIDLDAICPGLREGTEHLRYDSRLRLMAHELGQTYMEDGSTLLHGDYYPGSWLQTAKGFRMIDPEFCFFGHPEFELAVAVAHLKMAQQPDSLLKDLFIYYHFDKYFDGSLFTKFAGMEIIRRLIGVAQLPLELTLNERLDLLEEARWWVLKG
ncbi:MAG: phosphotransferase [Flavobacteriales bacterium]|nr:phosphotransferase [Flavobacteriales bacterium]